MLADNDKSNIEEIADTLTFILTAPFVPFVIFFKELYKTFTPYESGAEALIDLVQPLIGIYQLCTAALSLVAAVIVFPIIALVAAIAILPASILLALGVMNDCENSIVGVVLGIATLVVAPIVLTVLTVALVAMATVATALHIAGKALLGATQLLTTPLTWCIRMPLRGIITAFENVELPSFSNPFKSSSQRNNDDDIPLVANAASVTPKPNNAKIPVVPSIAPQQNHKKYQPGFHKAAPDDTASNDDATKQQNPVCASQSNSVYG